MTENQRAILAEADYWLPRAAQYACEAVGDLLAAEAAGDKAAANRAVQQVHYWTDSVKHWLIEREYCRRAL